MDTIRPASATAVSPLGQLVVALLRRLAALLIALIACLSLAGTAFASARDVINDYQDDGVIAECHPRADYDAARREKVDAQYGDFPGAIDAALATPALVGTAAKPCKGTSDGGGSGAGGAALIAIPVALVLLGGAIVFARRRRSQPPGPGDAS